MLKFDHEKLDVYHLALEFIVIADDVAGGLPSGRAYLSDQLHCAASSIVLNIAEGAGEFSKKDKARFYRMARRSAAECAGVLDVCRTLKLSDEKTLAEGREVLLRVVAMLVGIIRSMGDSGIGKGRGIPETK